MRALALAAAALLWHGSASASVFVVRHAERRSAKDDASLLSRKGHRRARALSRLLAKVALKAVYATEYERTQQTARPTAAARGLEVTVRGSEGAAELARELRALPPEVDVLVVGHTDTIPDLLRGLGVPEPIVIPDDEFGVLYIVTPRGDATPLLHRLVY